MEAAYQENKNQGLVVLAIDIGEGRSEVVEYIARNGYTFPVLLDEDKKVTEEQYLVFMHPETFFLDREGIYRLKSIGPMKKEAIVAKYWALIASPAASRP